MTLYNPQFIKVTGAGKALSADTVIHTDIPVIQSTLNQALSGLAGQPSAYRHIHFVPNIPEAIASRIQVELGVPYVGNEEGFVIDAADEITIYASTERGLFYGCISLLGLVKEQAVDRLFAYDYPSCEVRGLKVYLPSEENIDYFKQLIDMLCQYKYNTVMIEVGGAMEYKLHPEINAGWIDYCKEMSEYSGKTREIQDHTYRWYKNSIHVENGEGGFLSQERVRELVNYCKERMMNVIAEVPSLSHCDYLMLNHREIAERPEDPYPDTYCPSNPKSYELLFDILDEVVEVFEPSVVNIGHDEYYSIGLCEHCKEKKAEEIFAEDIKKIQAYLADKGVKTMIWGDKLLTDMYIHDAGSFGGDEVKMYFPAFKMNTGEFTGNVIPPTYKAIDLLPHDVEILHWSWSHGEHLDRQFVDKGLNVTFGNFEGHNFPDWSRRISAGVKGAIISNWSTLSELILQRNNILYTMVFSYSMLWRQDYMDAKYPQIRDSVLEELFHFKYAKALESSGDAYYEIIHTTDYKELYTGFVDGVFIDEAMNRIGDYVLQYEDGSEQRIPIKYGENISTYDVAWGRTNSEICAIYKIDDRLAEVSLTTLPISIKGETYYKLLVKNEHPGKKMTGISITYNDNKSCSVRLLSFRQLQ